MKQFIIILFAIFGFSVFANAQQEGIGDLEVGTQGLERDNIERRLERNDRRIEHERHSKRPKTWVDRGIIYQDMFDVDTEFLYFGMAEDELTLLMDEPNEIQTEEMELGVRTVMIYDDIEVYFEDGILTGYKEFDPMHDDPVVEAYGCFQKAAELLEKEELNFFQRIFTADQERRLKDAYIRLYGQFFNQAVLEFGEDNFSRAYELFAKAIDVADSPYYDEPLDESVVFNAGYVATLAGEKEDALQYYIRATEMGHEDVNIYALIAESYMEFGDTLKAETALQEGFEKFPENNMILVELINFYIDSDKSEAALNYLELATEMDPNNAMLYYAEGSLLDRLGEDEKAVESYETALEIDPGLYEVNFNLGVYYYNKAVNMIEEAQEITDNIEYTEALNVAADVMAESLPYLEKAHEINPDDTDVMETLRIVYYRLGQEEELREMYDKLGREYDLDEDL